MTEQRPIVRAEQGLDPLAQRVVGATGLVQVGRPIGRTFHFHGVQKNLAFGHVAVTRVAGRAAAPSCSQCEIPAGITPEISKFPGIQPLVIS